MKNSRFTALAAALCATMHSMAQAPDPAAQEDNIIAQDAHEQEEDIVQHNIDFEDVDADMDGILSFEEAASALPALAFEDTNGDGQLSQREVEAAIPDFKFSTHGHSGGDALVGKPEFTLIMDTLRTRDMQDHSAHP